VYIRVAKGGDPIVSRPDIPVRIGQALSMRDGRDALIVTTGVGLQVALDAADRLALLGVQTGVLHDEATLARAGAIAHKKAVTETEWEIFTRGVGCNWLVCLGVWMALAAEDVAGKILAIFFPIMAFVALGFDHVVANMFFLPAAIFADAGDVTWGDTLHNWLFAGLGNFVGAAVFVSTAYWYMYGREDEPEKEKGAGDTERTPQGRYGRDGAGAEQSEPVAR
jgi:hypothetical protein